MKITIIIKPNLKKKLFFRFLFSEISLFSEIKKKQQLKEMLTIRNFKTKTLKLYIHIIFLI